MEPAQITPASAAMLAETISDTKRTLSTWMPDSRATSRPRPTNRYRRPMLVKPKTYQISAAIAMAW